MAGRLGRIDPRLEIFAAEFRKGEEQVAEVALRIDGEDGDAVDRSLFEQRDREPRLAAARHADDHAVRGQIFCVVDQRRFGSFARFQVVLSTDVEAAELLVAFRCSAFVGGLAVCSHGEAPYTRCWRCGGERLAALATRGSFESAEWGGWIGR